MRSEGWKQTTHTVVKTIWSGTASCEQRGPPAACITPQGDSGQRKVNCDELLKRSLRNIIWPDCSHWSELDCCGDRHLAKGPAVKGHSDNDKDFWKLNGSERVSRRGENGCRIKWALHFSCAGTSLEWRKRPGFRLCLGCVSHSCHTAGRTASSEIKGGLSQQHQSWSIRTLSGHNSKD